MHQVDLTPLYASLNEAVGLFLAGLATTLAGMVGLWLKRHLTFLSAQTDAAITAGFNTALQNGANIALNSLHEYEGQHSTVAVQSWLAAKAADYAIEHNQDFVKRFTGKTPDELSDAALEFIGKKALAYVPPVAVNDGTVTVHGETITLGKPSPAGQTEAEEKAETADLNKKFNHLG